MAYTTLTIRIDTEIKKEFETVCDELGLTMTSAVTLLAKQMIRERRLPFEITAREPIESQFRKLQSYMEFFEMIGTRKSENEKDDILSQD